MIQLNEPEHIPRHGDWAESSEEWMSSTTEYDLYTEGERLLFLAYPRPHRSDQRFIYAFADPRQTNSGELFQNGIGINHPENEMDAELKRYILSLLALHQ